MRPPVRRRIAAIAIDAALLFVAGPTKRHRLNQRGNRQLNHAIHLAAVTQISRDTPGAVYYQRKIASGTSMKEAMRALKRQISDALFRQLRR